MNKAILILTLAVLILAPRLRAEDAKHPPINPALLYWQAAAALPQLTDDQATELRDMASGQLPFDAQKAGKLLVNKESLRLAEKAANSTVPCDWGLPVEDGPMMALPHVAKIRQLAGLAVLQAETSFAEGKVQEGTKWLVITHRMARHAGAGDLLICFLVQCSIETNAIRAAGRHCLSWNDTTRQGYVAMLKQLPPLHSVEDAWRGENVFIDWVERGAAADDQARHEVDQMMRALAAGKPADKEAIAAQLAPDALKATAADWRELQSRLAAAVAKPWNESQPEIKALIDGALKSPHLIIRDAVPAVGSVAETGFILATLRTMLDAALRYGPALDETAASGYRDALEGEPLRFKKNDDGTFTLLAAHQHPATKDLKLSLGK